MAQYGSKGGKILSCCYCGVQSSFLPRASKHGAGLSALICSTCGAPLAAQKARPLAPGKGARLPQEFSASMAVAPSKPKPKKSKSSKAKHPSQKPQKSKPRKKRKSLFQKFVSEAVDLVEDIFE
ncbi:hypothetical protein [Pseudophaeobacter sp.]|uniref:hypothetical protein n=1 Tax=Pseudophaeobacter sp. TaxID=1971739 RepID=UPI0032980815